MEAPKVSVIIPVYNAGHRLKACIESLVSQTLKELELIFVLDCPTDGSDKIVMEYSKKYDNIIVITNERNLNIGLSRNEGLKAARGEYVAFCDHDDIVKEYMYEEMYNVGKQQDADIVLGVPEYSYEDSSMNEIYYYPQEGDVKDILMPLIIGRDETKRGWEFYYSHGVIWDNIYKREFLIESGICFIDNNKLTFEDNLFLIEALIHANKAVVYNKLVYVHTIEENNTAASIDFVKKDKILAYVDYLHDILSDNNIYEKYYSNFSKSVCSYLKGSIRREFKQTGKCLKSTKVFVDELKSSNLTGPILRSVDLSDFLYGSNTLKSKILDVFLYSYLKL